MTQSVDEKVRSRHVRPFVIVTAIAAAFPLLVLIDFSWFVLQVWAEHGRWPRFGDPDPQGLEAVAQRARITVGLLWSPTITLAALGLAVAGRLRDRTFPMGRLLALAMFSACLFLWVSETDPGGFLNWFFD